MSLKNSYIFKENLNITFTYKDRAEVYQEKNRNVFQSVIFHKTNQYGTPLAQITKSPAFESNLRNHRILAQSMYQQNCQSLINRSYCEGANSVGVHRQTGLAKLMGLCVRQIQQQKYEASIEDFQIGQLLGKGAMGNVFMCRHKQTGFFFALKKIKKKTVTDIQQLICSIKVHMFLDQPNIVKLYSVFNDQQNIYFLMQLCTDGNLKSQANNIKNDKHTKKMILGIAYGLRHLHRRNIRHGDIKLQNILCCYGMPKISDFDCISYGKIKNTPDKKLNSKILGSPLYFSPQMMRQSICGLHDDVWSLGIITYQLLCGCYPFQVKNPSDISNIIYKNIKQFPPNTDKFLQQLTRKMLLKRLCERPKLSSIIKQLQKD